MVKNVIDIRTRERFDNPISRAVTNPHGIEMPSSVMFEEVERLYGIPNNRAKLPFHKLTQKCGP